MHRSRFFVQLNYRCILLSIASVLLNSYSFWKFFNLALLNSKYDLLTNTYASRRDKKNVAYGLPIRKFRKDQI
jgi:hypothetical protein